MGLKRANDNNKETRAILFDVVLLCLLLTWNNFHIFSKVLLVGFEVFVGSNRGNKIHLLCK